SSELKLTDLSKKYDVDYNKLYRRSKGRPRYGQPGQNTRLTCEQEIAVCEQLDFWDEVGISATPALLTSITNAILRNASADGNFQPVGKHWHRRFIQRYPKYQIRTRKALAILRKKAITP